MPRAGYTVVRMLNEVAGMTSGMCWCPGHTSSHCHPPASGARFSHQKTGAPGWRVPFSNSQAHSCLPLYHQSSLLLSGSSSLGFHLQLSQWPLWAVLKASLLLPLPGHPPMDKLLQPLASIWNWEPLSLHPESRLGRAALASVAPLSYPGPLAPGSEWICSFQALGWSWHEVWGPEGTWFQGLHPSLQDTPGKLVMLLNITHPSSGRHMNAHAPVHAPSDAREFKHTHSYAGLLPHTLEAPGPMHVCEYTPLGTHLSLHAAGKETRPHLGTCICSHTDVRTKDWVLSGTPHPPCPP